MPLGKSTHSTPRLRSGQRIACATKFKSTQIEICATRGEKPAIAGKKIPGPVGGRPGVGGAEGRWAGKLVGRFGG